MWHACDSHFIVVIWGPNRCISEVCLYEKFRNLKTFTLSFNCAFLLSGIYPREVTGDMCLKKGTRCNLVARNNQTSTQGRCDPYQWVRPGTTSNMCSATAPHNCLVKNGLLCPYFPHQEAEPRRGQAPCSVASQGVTQQDWYLGLWEVDVHALSPTLLYPFTSSWVKTVIKEVSHGPIYQQRIMQCNTDEWSSSQTPAREPIVLMQQNGPGKTKFNVLISYLLSF